MDDPTKNSSTCVLASSRPMGVAISQTRKKSLFQRSQIFGTGLVLLGGDLCKQTLSPLWSSGPTPMA
jgi:hypothetical protein